MAGSQAPGKPIMPKDLAYQGQKLWKSVTDEFDLSIDPHKHGASCSTPARPPI